MSEPGIYIYTWGNNERRGDLKGRRCRILTRGGKGTVLIEFLDTGEKVTTSFRALRKAPAYVKRLGAPVRLVSRDIP